MLCGITVFQADEAQAAMATVQSVGAAKIHSHAESRDTSPVAQLSYTSLPTQKHVAAAGQAPESTPLSTPDVLDRCIVLSDASSRGETPVSNVATPPPIIDSVTPPPPPGVSSFCKHSTCDEDVTDEQETTPLSVRTGRKRRRHKRRFHRSKRGGSKCPSDVSVKAEPRMPKLLPEPRVEYNPETPLRISIHLPMTGVIDADEDGVLGKNVGRSEAAVDCTSEVCLTAMPVDLTSRASVTMTQSNSASSAAADVKHSYSYSVSSSVLSPRPVYSPISSISGRSTPEVVETENVIGNSRQDVPPQQSVGIIASFLDRFHEMSAQQSLDFSQSQSMWTRSFAEQLVAVNRDSFLAAHDFATSLIATDQHRNEVHCRRSLDSSDRRVGRSSLVSNSVMNNVLSDSIRHNTHNAQDYATVRPTVAASSGLSRVYNIGPLNASHSRSQCEVGTKVPVLSNGNSHSSADGRNMNGIFSSENETLPGLFLKEFFSYIKRLS